MSVYHEALLAGRIHAADFAVKGGARRALKAIERAEAEQRNAETPYERTKRYWREHGKRWGCVMDELTIEQRVAAGAAWLDEHAPGWVAQIDLSSLDIEEPCNCILGQVYGHYFKSPRQARILFEDDYIADERGFNGAEEDMAPLNRAWADLILDRRREASRG